MHSGIDPHLMNTDVRAQDDLFVHVNGGWLASAQIPADRARYGSFDQLRESAEEAVRELIEQAAERQPALDTRAGKVGALYASFMDEDRVEQLGVEPAVEPLVEVAGVSSPSDVARVAGALQREGVDGIVHLWVTADAGNPEEYIAYLHQAGIGLPDEAYYTAAEHAGVRTAYRAYLAQLLELGASALTQAGLDLDEGAVDRVYALEERIAAAHRDRVAARDAVKSYTRWTADELAERTRGWDWDAFRAGLGAGEHHLAHVVARQPEVLTAVGAALAEVPVSDWRAYLAVRVLDGLAPCLSGALVEAHFDFHGRTLSGTPSNKERWKRGVGLVEGLLGEAAGEMYVAAHYPPAASEKMSQLVQNVTEAFRQRIGELEWMGEETKAKALDKLAAFRPKVGHPPVFRDYTAYQLDPTDLLGNVRRGAAFETDRQLAKIGRPIDRDEWLMTPQTVNAYYHPMLNEIVFPAAILQPPFFDVDADDAVNYGGIGAVIAHEIGHGFDDQGSRYAGDGSLTDWWTQEDRERFEERSQQLIDQFSQLSPRDIPEDTVTVNGGLTVGENIGDLCGLELAHLAYTISHGGAAPEIDGWTGDQRFFLGWGAVWRTIAREEEARRLLSVDPHAPADLRANTVRNVDAFHAAFETTEGDGLWLAPQERVRVF
ncbi:M13 family metallopeptidase [Ornithinimicrobium pratense]|uniref:Peptidase M13 n=1 Tax=Ornithinimicrobium pratense TaxID=2593973 RepID=A0A5J6V8F8_9MICO|nr:M13-type metalloendopeptidase [Ornithinimicrobium pratense]QFG69416.1 peptidase M13 [Ornithinimicrobium pratense]